MAQRKKSQEKCKHFNIFKKLVQKIDVCIGVEIQGLMEFISVWNLNFLTSCPVQFVLRF